MHISTRVLRWATACAASVALLVPAGTAMGQTIEENGGAVGVATESAASSSNALTDYLFVHFTDETDQYGEQIYFATSPDGLAWTDLRPQGQPILDTLDLPNSEKGVRDPYILRGQDGKFYILATDLGIWQRGQVSESAWAGTTDDASTNIVVWESEDLVNWSEPRLLDVASNITSVTGATAGQKEKGGCAWAPEAVWDEEKQQYVVFFAVGDDPADEYGVEYTDSTHSTVKSRSMNMYYVTTKDFKSVSDPVKWIDYKGAQLDSSVIKVGDWWYRATGSGTIYLEKSKNIYATAYGSNPEHNLNAENGWQFIGNLNNLKGDSLLGYKASLEGGELFQYNQDDWQVDSEGNPVPTWGFMGDRFSQKKGYTPYRTTNLDDATGESWSSVPGLNFGSLKKRHGAILPITHEEYLRITKAFSVNPPSAEVVLADYQKTADYAMDRENDKLKDSVGGNDAEIVGFTDANFSTSDGDAVLNFTGAANQYVKLPQGVIDPEDEQFAIETTFTSLQKADQFLWTLGTKTGTWPNVKNYMFLNPQNKAGDLGVAVKDASTEKYVSNTGTSGGSSMTTVLVVFDHGEVSVFKNGTQVGSTLESGYSIKQILADGVDDANDAIGYIGRSLYTSDKWFKGSLTHFTVYGAKNVDPNPAEGTPVLVVDAGVRGDDVSSFFADAAKGGSLLNKRADQSYRAADGWGSLGGVKLHASDADDRDSDGLVATGRTLRYRFRLDAGSYSLQAGVAGFGSARSMSQKVAWAGGSVDGDVVSVEADGVATADAMSFSLDKPALVTFTLSRADGSSANPTLTWLQVNKQDSANS